MPMSSEALTGLPVAIAWNPDAARELLGILRAYSGWVKYKSDPYGPLHFILGHPHRRRIAPGVSFTVNPPPFPEDQRPAFAAFGQEWLERRFTKQELAVTLARLLAELSHPALNEFAMIGAERSNETE